jgi:3-dehydroquinate dehydratase-1/3-dehydroquinate dehydratase/shikimate dehydrogenase
LVTTAKDHHDVLSVLQLQVDAEELNLPLIAFCMGSAGVISRLATLKLGGYMTYCAPNEREATAPGQIPAGVMRSLMQSLFPGEGGTA